MTHAEPRANPRSHASLRTVPTLWIAACYALLLTDCHMPNLDGFELTEIIRSEQRGMDDYLSKPPRMTEMAPMLQKWLPEPDSGATFFAPVSLLKK